MKKRLSLIGIVFILLTFGLAVPVQAANIWAVGNLVGLCKGTEIREGPGLAYRVHTLVPENDWTVKVIGGPRSADGQTWWDTSRFAAGDPSGGTGWVSQSQADNCPPDDGGGGSDGGGGDGGGGDGGGGGGGFTCSNWIFPFATGINYFHHETPLVLVGPNVYYSIDFSAQMSGQYCGSQLTLVGGKEFELQGNPGSLTFDNQYQLTGIGLQAGTVSSKTIVGVVDATPFYPGDPYFGTQTIQKVYQDQIINIQNTHEFKNIFRYNRLALAFALVVASVFVVYVMATAVAATLTTSALAELATILILWFTQVTGGAPAPVLQTVPLSAALRTTVSSQQVQKTLAPSLLSPSQSAIDLFKQQYGAMEQWADFLGLNAGREVVSAYTQFVVSGSGFTPDMQVYYEFGLPGQSPILRDVVTADPQGQILVAIEMPAPDQILLGNYLFTAFDYATINQTMLGALKANTDPIHFRVGVTTVEVVQDVMPPTITISSPSAKAYTRCDQPAVLFEVADDLSGVASVRAWIDGIEISNDEALDMLFWDLGEHTLAVQAFDKVGWEQNSSVTFNLEATIKGTKCALLRFQSLELLKTNGVYTSINAHLDAADRALQNNKSTVARNELTSIVKVLEAQKKHMDASAYRILTGDIHSLLSNPIR